MTVPDVQSDEHEVTPLELFFDLTFVFAMTQVTILLADDPTWGGVLLGMLVLAALWWAWSAYAWLTSATDVDEGGVRLVVLASMGGMFGVALAVPGAFGDDAVLFGVAYLLVRLLHLVLSATVVRDDPDRRGALLRFAPTAILGPSLLNATLALGIAAVPPLVRIARGEALALREEDYVRAAVANGANDAVIIGRHIVPNMASTLLVQATLTIPAAIIGEAVLSFLGLGVQPPTPSWGVMLNAAQSYLGEAPSLAVYPGLAIVIVALAFNLLGDGLRDVLDPKTER